MIQRVQSVYLFIAAVFMALLFVLPMGMADVGGKEIALMAGDSTVSIVLDILIVVMLLIAIFLYKNLRLQRTVAGVSVLLIVMSLIAGCIMLCGETVRIVWCGGLTCQVLALIMSLLAYRGISRDIRLLDSYDRLR